MVPENVRINVPNKSASILRRHHLFQLRHRLSKEVCHGLDFGLELIFYQILFSDPSGEDNRRVRTLYACVGEHDSELSFEPNQVITDGKFDFL